MKRISKLLGARRTSSQERDSAQATVAVQDTRHGGVIGDSTTQAGTLVPSAGTPGRLTDGIQAAVDEEADRWETWRRTYVWPDGDPGDPEITG
jgi:hypothetical protein